MNPTAGCTYCEGTGRTGSPLDSDDLSDAECPWCGGRGRQPTPCEWIEDQVRLFRYESSRESVGQRALPSHAISALAEYLDPMVTAYVSMYYALGAILGILIDDGSMCIEELEAILERTGLLREIEESDQAIEYEFDVPWRLSDV